MTVRLRLVCVLLAGVLAGSGAASVVQAQQQPIPVPRPFPVPPPGTNPPAKPPASGPAESVPTQATLGLPIYPAARFLTSYDAGRGQRYYLFGATIGFNEMVAYYRTALKQKGELVFDAPAVHVFEVGRFNEDTMAFPPGVTVKDYTWGGSGGYLNPRAGAQPQRFPTIVQIVPLPSGAPPR